MISEALAADENLVIHATHAAGQLPAARVDARADLVLVDSGLPCDTFNFACRPRLAPVTARARIVEALDFFSRTGHPHSWWLAPGYTPADLPELLREVGLEAAESELAMALDLAALAPSTPPPSLEIRRVRTAPELAAFAATTAANWSPPDPQVVRFYDQASACLLEPDCPQWLYLGWVDGEPVATAELTVGGGVVGVYNISTRIGFRGRGIGSAMTAQPLAEASSAGHRTAVLQAAPDGVRIYQRLGFRQQGTITEFKLPAQPPM